jgi:hypothetical protein
VKRKGGSSGDSGTVKDLSDLTTFGIVLFIGYYLYTKGFFQKAIDLTVGGLDSIKDIPKLSIPYGVGAGDNSGGDFGSGNLSGTNIYKTTGKKCSCSSGSQQISCSGGSATSKRVNCNNCGLQNYEATALLQFGGGCTSACGDEATIKHYGPTHQDGNCCWALSNVQQNGQCFFGGEGPHPDTDKSQQSLGSVGNLQGKKVGIKSISIKTSGGVHQELYVDPTGSMSNWKKMGSRDISQWGNSQKSNKIGAKGGPQQVEFRVDCSGAKWLSYDVSEIAPSSAGMVKSSLAHARHNYGYLRKRMSNI